MILDKANLELKINVVLQELRPFFEADGGDIKFVEITDEGILKVELMGACSGCSMSLMTLKSGVEEAVKKIAPEIISVEAINLPLFV
jgi:Fe-S cluster biogenesis protein NfuA